MIHTGESTMKAAVAWEVVAEALAGRTAAPKAVVSMAATWMYCLPQERVLAAREQRCT